jgi:hypothetical protein
MNLKGFYERDRGLFEIISLHLPLGTKKTRETSVRMASVPVEFTYANLLGPAVLLTAL